MVYVGIDTKQALENCVHNILEVGWKWCAWIKKINTDQLNLTVPIIRSVPEKLGIVHNASNIPSF
jgi:hypothetical protein